MLRRVALVRTDVSEERIASIIRVTGIAELGTLAVIRNRSKPNLVSLMLIREVTRSSETSVLTRATRRDIPDGGILQRFSAALVL
jgi:hypothetical protein